MKDGWSDAARELAISALGALSDRQPEPESEDGSSDGGQKHVMLSYQWDVQGIVVRINESLQSRGYMTCTLDLLSLRLRVCVG